MPLIQPQPFHLLLLTLLLAITACSPDPAPAPDSTDWLAEDAADQVENEARAQELLEELKHAAKNPRVLE